MAPSSTPPPAPPPGGGFPPEPKKATAAAPSNSVASVTVRLPADAKLFVDDVACPLTSDVRSFATPALQPGQQYAYTMRAEVVRDGTTRTESQRVLVRAGQAVEVRFGALPAVATVQR
jgi:uncharacterized protein (TIGR03000 family)